MTDTLLPPLIPLQNQLATNQFEIVVGADNIIRINIDGICALRTRIGPDCEITMLDQEREIVTTLCARTLP